MVASRLGWFRTSGWDAVVLGASVLHGALLAGALGVAAGGVGSWGAGPHALAIVMLGAAMNWGSNTVSHIHLHTPLFRHDGANRVFSLYLSVLLCVPQGWWKERHLGHHRSPESRLPSVRAALRRQGLWEAAALVAALGAMAAAAPAVFAGVYLPAMLVGLGLCAIQGREEHVGSAAGVDVHAPLYNRLWFNDGFHAAHHRRPDAHWTTLPARAAAGDVVSALPPTLRWLGRAPSFANRVTATVIDGLERATLRVPPVRRFLLATHERAWSRLLAPTDAATIRAVTIVGGGLFPRTALILARLLPHARLTIVEAVPAHAACARRFLADTSAAGARFVESDLQAHLDARAGVAARDPECDLLVLPLAFRGDRTRFYGRPPARLVAIHDWCWRARGTRGTRVSLALLKRLNLVDHRAATAMPHGSQVDVVQVHATGGAGTVPQPAGSAGSSWMS